jgi:site-specific recombinase XerD
MKHAPLVSAPVITIYVRHAARCKYADDEFCKRCNCRKHFRWTLKGTQHRQKAGTRSWAEAEEIKANLAAQLSGKAPAADAQPPKTIDAAVTLFKTHQLNQGWTADVLGKYARELARLQAWAEARGIFTIAGLTGEVLIAYQGTWAALYPSTQTRSMVNARLRNFLRFSYDNKWLDRVPKTSRIKVDEAPTLPLTAKEYEHLLKTIPKTFADATKAARVRALIQAMRWSGLAIHDVVTLRRDELTHDKKAGLYSIQTARQKTGTHVSVPVPPDVAKEILTVANGNPVYFFWTGSGKETSATTNWQHDIRALFKDAEIQAAGNMLSHRLRDTFAVDLLEKGVPLEEVSKLLGHESIKTTERSYAKWVKGRQDRLNKLVIGTWTKAKRR